MFSFRGGKVYVDITVLMHHCGDENACFFFNCID